VKNTDEIRNIEELEWGSWWRHYKGNIYNIVCTGLFQGSDEECVVYQHIHTGLIKVRSFKSFIEKTDSGVPRYEEVEARP
jgi:hypothetical protein